MTAKGILVFAHLRLFIVFTLFVGVAKGTLENRNTQLGIPSMAPNTTDGLYEVSSEENGSISIQLYFTPLDTCALNDNPIHVVYSVEALDKSVIVPHPNFSVTINVPKNREVNISLEAKNSAGPSNKTKVVTIFPEISTPKAAKLNMKHINKDSGCTEEATITQTEDSTLFKYLYNTVVWCPVNLTVCQEPLKWVCVHTNKTVVPIPVCMPSYRYGLITHGYNWKERKVTSTSIHWLDFNTTVHGNDGFEPETGYVFSVVVLVFAVFVINVLCIVFIADQWKSRSAIATFKQPICTTSPSSSSSNSVYYETDGLLKHLEESLLKHLGESRSCTVWTKCIYQKNVVSAAKISHDKILPTNNELQQIYCTFGRMSNTLRDACANICGFIAQKLGNVTEVWPAYAPSNDRIVFVVERSSTESTIRVNDFKLYTVDPVNTLEKESLKVMLREQEVLANYDNYDVDKFKQLKESISNNARSVMDKNKTIIALCPSVVKSVGYNTSGQHKLIETLCISIRVEKKVRDVIPLDEDLIPADIGGFPTDVLQGTFSAFGKGPNDFQKELKIGCGIHAGVTDSNGDVLGGTLGAFVQHGKHSLCCITCAHVMLSPAELQNVKTNGYIECAYETGKRVFQLSGEHSTEFGRLVAAALKEGSHTSPGVEAALIKVLCRHPKSGSFPKANEGSDANKDFVFNSGNVTDANNLKPMTEVYKFGISTGPTVGDLGLTGTAVRMGCNQVNDSKFGIQLYNQLEIYPKVNSFFAKKGDSGALVFIGHTRPSTAAAIGIVEGGFENGKILVTPLFEVLEALKCPSYLKRFEDSSDSGVQVDMPQGVEETMDWN